MWNYEIATGNNKGPPVAQKSVPQRDGTLRGR